MHTPGRGAHAASLSALYGENHTWLQDWLRRRLGNAADAADLAHDTFIRLMSAASSPRFDTLGHARSYLRKTAQHLCIDLWRRQEIERAWAQTLAACPPAFYPSAERQVAVLQALQEISQMLDTLPGKAAQAFVLAAGCRMTDDEIGAELGVSGRMVRKYMAQAMLGCLKLRACQTAAELRTDAGYA